MKKIITIMMAIALSFTLAACGSSSSSSSAAKNYADGTYTGRSADHDADESGNGSGYGEVTIEIKDNKVVNCEFKMYELDGTLKDDSYGADLSKENRLKAQKAVQSAPKYAAALVDAGTLDGVDALSGATISFEEFEEAVKDALSKAAS